MKTFILTCDKIVFFSHCQKPFFKSGLTNLAMFLFLLSLLFISVHAIAYKKSVYSHLQLHIETPHLQVLVAFIQKSVTSILKLLFFQPKLYFILLHHICLSYRWTVLSLWWSFTQDNYGLPSKLNLLSLLLRLFSMSCLIKVWQKG